ncbi:uncharacterized protein DSM5745_11122 [Aspergillus mulundensis]|uniref:Cytochrome P450 n=1 Tax=Aspergillus mulundensis TaxID=1810919 RepID=A0A3D8QAQ1_9EURO|nr:hypothetical protein DSM5745_11122 [Aspergillus mulundensis]RDW58916.1 hypothetical protein DSM5745_11122 [Aspergillus mulundensis]
MPLHYASLSLLLVSVVLTGMALRGLCLYMRLRHVPSPLLNKFLRIKLSFHELRLQRNEAIASWHARYGPVVCIGPNEVSVASCQGIKDIYSSTNQFPKSAYFDHFAERGHRSMFATRPYRDHQRKRALTSSFYQASNIYTRPDIEAHIQERVTAVLGYIRRRSQEGTNVDVYALTDWYGFDIITYIVFGHGHGTRTVEDLAYEREREILRHLKHLQRWGPFRVLFPRLFEAATSVASSVMPSLEYLQADKKLSRWSRERTSHILQSSTPNPRCLLGKLAARYHGEQQSLGAGQKSAGLSREFIAAEVLDNINAAEATIAVTATYFLYHLSASPGWQRRLADEVRQLRESSECVPPFSAVNQLPIMEACLKEVYRLHPASSGRAERVVPSGGRVVSGLFLPEGGLRQIIVTSAVTSLQRRGTVFPDPDSFRPEHWLQNDAQGRAREREAYLIPFGHGARLCLGKALATMEIKMLIAGIYLHYETALADSCTVESMRQLSTHDAVPSGLRCEIVFRRLD